MTFPETVSEQLHNTLDRQRFISSAVCIHLEAKLTSQLRRNLSKSAANLIPPRKVIF